MTLLEAVMAEVKGAVSDVVTQIADGVSFSDAKPLLLKLKNRLVVVAQAFEASGPDKKEAVLLGLEAFFDLAVARYDIPFVPEIVEKPIEAYARTKIRGWIGPMIDDVCEFAHVVATVIINPWKKEA